MFPFPAPAIIKATVIVAVTTWDPDFKPASVSLSANKLVANGGSSNNDNMVRGTTSKTDGKLYFECRQTGTGSYILAGISNASANTSTFPGQNSSGIGIGYATSVYDKGVSGSSGLPGVSPGDVIGVYVDFSARLLWFSVNGAFASGKSPAAGTGGYTLPSGAIYPAVDVPSSTAECTANFGQSSFIYGPAAGFTAWG